jgi:ABC-type lipoprotein release transport system permease subunit
MSKPTDLGQGARLIISGLVVGVAAAVGRRGIASTLLFGVTPGDPLTYLMAAAAFSAVAFAAVMIPACRASLVEPIKALRSE